MMQLGTLSRPTSTNFDAVLDAANLQAFDPRALSPGDILTVRIEIDDRARFKNESERSRTSSRTLGVI